MSQVGDGARLLVVVSGGYHAEEQRAAGRTRVRRLLAAGCGVVDRPGHGHDPPMAGAQVVLLDAPAVASEVLGAASTSHVAMRRLASSEGKERP